MEEPNKQTVAEGLAQMMDLLATLREACNGYRKQLEADGWSPESIETTVLMVHTALLAKMFGMD